MIREEQIEHLAHVLNDLKAISKCNEGTLKRALHIQENLDKRLGMLDERMDRICNES